MKNKKSLAKELYNAISHSDTKRAQEILEKNPFLLKMKTPIGSWLHVAATYGDLNIVKYLVESGLDVNASDGTSGSNPLNFAVSEGHIEIVKYFLDNGAILDLSKPERNPLFSAIHKGHLDIARLLVENGIDVTVDYGSKNAISFAEVCGQIEILDFLKGVSKTDKKDTLHECVLNHLRQHFEKVNELSLMEIMGTLMIHIIPSSPERNCIILATSGASIRNAKKHYELLMYLPANWNLSDLEDLNNYWPIAWIRKVASYEKMVYPEDTFSNEETYESLAPNTQLSGFIVLDELNDYGKLELQNGEIISFLVLIPLYKEEIELKKKEGTIELLKRFQKKGITLVLDLERPNVGR